MLQWIEQYQIFPDSAGTLAASDCEGYTCTCREERRKEGSTERTIKRKRGWEGRKGWERGREKEGDKEGERKRKRGRERGGEGGR